MITNSKSKPDFFQQLQNYKEKGWITEKIQETLRHFFQTYQDELITDGIDPSKYHSIFFTFLDLIKKQLASPYVFGPFHKQLREPFDYYTFGVDFLRPLIDLKNSSTHGLNYLKEILGHIKKGHNAILFSNHQIEGDPQAISVLLEDHAPELATDIIHVAGERVLTDPLAVPFSLGRNLLCIYSKRYIDNPPELKHHKQFHNKATMQMMSSLLQEGGKCIWVAPSGGRDRPNAQGEIEVAPFDPQSIEMFYLMAKKAKTPTFFYPLALKTYAILPPPLTIQVELGEKRTTKREAVHLAFGPQIAMEQFPISDTSNKHEQRKARAEYIYNLVKTEYANLA